MTLESSYPDLLNYLLLSKNKLQKQIYLSHNLQVDHDIINNQDGNAI